MNNDQRAESEKGPRQVLEVLCGKAGVCRTWCLAVRILRNANADEFRPRAGFWWKVLWNWRIPCLAKNWLIIIIVDVNLLFLADLNS